MSNLETPLMESERTRIAHAKEITRLNDEIQRLEGEVEDWKKKAVSYHANEQLKAQIADLETKLAEKDEQIKQYSWWIEKRDARIASLEAEIFHFGPELSNE